MTKGHKDIFHGDRYAIYLDCGDALMGVNLTSKLTESCTLNTCGLSMSFAPQ